MLFASCTGLKACASDTSPIGTYSCNGEWACINANCSIGDRWAPRAVGDGSCNGELACHDFPCDALNPCVLAVGKNSCNGAKACLCHNPKGHTKIYDIGDGECNRQGIFLEGDLTCCVEGKVFPCDCTETPEGGLVVSDTDTCVSINRGFSGGTLKCYSNTCQFDTSECIASDCIGIWCFFQDVWLAFLSIIHSLICGFGLFC